MVNYLFEALCKYFNHLCNTGYMKQSEVNKLLLLAMVQKLIDCDFRGFLDERDYNIISKALYKLYGTSCLVPYPDYYKNERNRIMYTCSISELAYRVERLEKEGAGGSGIPVDLLDKEIVIPGDYYAEVDDVDVDEDNL